MFPLFEPAQPLTVAEAAGLRVGDAVNLDGKQIRVTLVDESRVYYIEGEAPEGVEVGDVAHYFNAEAGKQTIVVSWTGDEIEFYRGLDLPSGAVATAFGLATETPVSSLRSGAAGPVSSGWAGKLVVAILAVVIAFAAFSFLGTKRQPAAPVKPKTPPAPLSIGGIGKLNGTTYRIRGHTVVEIAQVGLLYDRHEYHLFDPDGGRVLLVCGAKPGVKDWMLLTPFQPETPLTPRQAAAKRSGDKVDLGGVAVSVTALFQSTIRQAQSQDLSDLTNGTVLYGFSAQSGTKLFLARWNEDGITFHQGRILPAKEVTDAFNLNAGK